MIFVLHYLLFNAGLTTVVILITLFLQTYAEASLSEIGTLLMALPFLSCLIKPLFGALADRHQAHRHYLMASLGVMALGYGSLSIAPFFPDFIQQHGRLVWYLDILGIIIGYSAFGIVWSLGDALAVNGAQMRGISWGYYRMWGVVSWGIVGMIVGQINEIPCLPKYVPAFFVLVGCLLVEIVLLAFWPNKYFVMCGTLQEPKQQGTNLAIDDGVGKEQQKEQLALATVGNDPDPLGGDWPANRSLSGTLKANGTLSGHASARMMGAVANILMDDLGGTLRSSLKLGSKSKRMGINEILEEHQNKMAAAAASEQQPKEQSATGSGFGRGTLRRLMSLSEKESAATATAGEAPSQTAAAPTAAAATAGGQVAEVAGGSATPTTTLGKAAALRAALIANQRQLESSGQVASTKQQVAFATTNQDLEQQPTITRAKSSEDLQLVLLKLIMVRDKTVGKYMVLFTLFGFLLTCHLSYFYLHLERLCREKGNDFSTAMGCMLTTHSISEMLAFIFVPRYINRVGRIGGLLTCSLAYLVRFAYYGTYFVDNSPYTGVPFEFCHGIAYGIVYTLITDIACECVNQVDDFLPELIERQLVEPDVNLNRLKSALRATMQGVFSGAFDGLGNGLGALFGGVFLDSYPFTSLWKFCAAVSLIIMVIYPLTEWRSLRGGPASDKKRPYISNLPQDLAVIEEKPGKELAGQVKVADGAK